MTYEDVELMFRLRQVPADHLLARLFARADSDPYARAWLTMWRTGRRTYEEAITELAVALSEDRERLIKMACDAAATAAVPVVIYLPAGSEEP